MLVTRLLPGISVLLCSSMAGTGTRNQHGTTLENSQETPHSRISFQNFGRFSQCTINDQAEILCSKLKSRVGDNLVNIYPFITHCALDIICETAMGRKINCQSDGNSPYVKAVYECQNLVFRRMCSPWLWNDFIFNFTPSGEKMRKCLDTIHDFTQTVIKERKREISEKSENNNNNEPSVDDIGRKRRLSFLDLLIESSKDGRSLTDEDIGEEVDTFMFAGHDTTASNISMTLYLLAHHPEAQSKCQEELDQIFLDSDRPATVEDLNSMKYLHSCIKESLRLYGSVPTIGRTTGEPVEVGGYFLPANTDIFLNMAVLHRDPTSFPDPEKFFPGRFLGSNDSGRHPYAYVPFSAGPRNCIGQKFAVMEEKAVISAVLEEKAVISAVMEEKAVISAVMEEMAVISAVLEEKGVISAVMEEKAVISAVMEEMAVISAVMEEKAVISAVMEEKAVISAVMEEKAVISAVLRKFQLHTSVAIEDVPLLPELVLKPRDGLLVQIRPRKL